MPNVSVGSKGKSSLSTKVLQEAPSAKAPVRAKKATANAAAKKVRAKQLAPEKRGQAATGKEIVLPRGRRGKVFTQPKIPLDAYVESEVQAEPGVKPAPRRKLASGAREFTRMLTAYLLPQRQVDPRSGGAGSMADVVGVGGFARAYRKMVQAVPAQNREGLIHDLRLALDEAAREAELKVPEPAAAEREDSVSTDEFMTQLRRQESAQWDKEIREEKLLPGLEMSRRLGVRPQSLSAALKKKRMFAIKGPSGDYYYPAFFAEDKKYDRPVLERVCMALGELPAGSKWDFFITQRISLGGKSPLEALAKGKVDAVMNAAKALVEE